MASTCSKALKCFQLFIHITELLLFIYTAESDEIAHPMNLRTQYPKTVSWNCKRQCSYSNFKLGIFIPPMYKICGYEVKFTGMTFYLEKIIGRNGHGPK